MDIPTLNLVNVFLSLEFAILMTLLWVSQNRISSIGYWAVAEWTSLFSFVASFLFYMTAQQFWIIISFAGFGLTFAFGVEGLSAFRRSRSLTRYVVLATIALTLGIAYLEALSYSLEYRVFLSTIGWIVFSTLMLQVVCLPGDRESSTIYHLFTFVYIGNIIFHLLRLCASPLVGWLGPLDSIQSQSLNFMESIVFKMGSDLCIVALIIQRIQTRLNYMAHYDDLTEIPNRRFFVDMAERELSNCRRTTKPCSLLMIDIDHFKNINDRWGHQAGDRVLFIFARVARRSLRLHDLLGRLGGEEFAVLLPETDLTAARDIAERLRLAVQEYVVDWENARITFTISVGVACFPQHGTNFDFLLNRADKALYHAKILARNRVALEHKSQPMRLQNA